MGQVELTLSVSMPFGFCVTVLYGSTLKKTKVFVHNLVKLPMGFEQINVKSSPIGALRNTHIVGDYLR